MSGTFDWLRPTTPTGGTRRCVLGAFVGALIVLAGNVLLGWPIGPSTSGQATDPATVAADAAVGDCLMWTQNGAGDLRAVDCGGAHVFEVTGSADLSSGYPSDAPFPDTASWQRITQQNCTGSVTTYLGRLDPNGRFTVGALKPTGTQWSSGDRTLRCGVEIATLTGLVSDTGSAKGADQSTVYPEGTCLALVNGVAGGPTDCGNPHAYEIVGVVDLHQRFPGGYPAIGDQQTALASLCPPIATNYTGGANLASYGLTLTWDTVSQESWTAGSHLVNCKVGELAPSGQALASVTNSIRGIGGAVAPPAAQPGGGATTAPGG
ncbi:MAG TPA: septum formation family protein [Pseudonocardiaceae bacterium]|jgi:hypothetical protein|nr:septum formation family protein [Pseudonocardiaceae bacterium]